MFIRVLNVTLVAFLVIFAFFNGLLISFGNSPQMSFTLIGSFVIYMASKPMKREIFIVILLGILFKIVYESTIGVSPYFGSNVISFLGFIGASSILVLLLTSIRKNDFFVFLVATFFPFITVIVGFILPITNTLSPVIFDAHLLAVSTILDIEPSFYFGRILSKHPLLWNYSTILYYALPLPVALLCSAHLTKNRGEVYRLLSLFGAMSIIGFCIYMVCPATGPIYSFHEHFPHSTPDIFNTLKDNIHYNNVSAPRNAMPSLHFSTALLVYWNTTNMQKFYRVLAQLFLVGTGFIILGLGEHYFIDIIVAFPFSLIFQATATCIAYQLYNNTSYFIIIMSIALVSCWLILLRFWIYPLINWSLIMYVFILITLIFTHSGRRKLIGENIKR